MFMIKMQLNMNNGKIRKYPKAGRVTVSPNAPLFSGLTIWLTIGVVVHIRCRKMGDHSSDHGRPIPSRRRERSPEQEYPIVNGNRRRGEGRLCI
jgi:hypothetical protein